MSKVLSFYLVLVFVVSIVKGFIDFFIAKKNNYDCDKCKVLGCNGKTCIKCRTK